MNDLQKVLITGSTGMVGRNLLENTDILGFEILSPNSSELNLLNYNDILSYLNKTVPDMIIHCAGKVGGIQANINDMYAFFTDNVVMGVNLIRAAKEVQIKRVLNLSSSCVYPRNFTNPLKEEYFLKGELEPTNEGYALAKLSIQKMCEYVAKENPELKYKTIIPCNLYGRWDKFDNKRAHLIPAIIKKIHTAIRTGVSEIEIWGDGTARREFMYASDLASVIAKIIKEFDHVPVIMNIGMGYDCTVGEYYEVVKKLLGYNGNFFYNTSKPVGMKQKLLDITKQASFGWKPSISLEEGIKNTYHFFLEHNDDKI